MLVCSAFQKIVLNPNLLLLHMLTHVKTTLRCSAPHFLVGSELAPGYCCVSKKQRLFFIRSN
jgi:hypothetical protein